jgi:signal transduction histidine kinase
MPAAMRRVALVVDPDPEVLHAVATALETLGLATVTARNAAGAHEHLGDERIVVVLLGVDASGNRTFVEAACARRPGLPVVVLTPPAAMARAIQLGAFDVLTKPVLPEELRLRVGRALVDERWDRTRRLLVDLARAAAAAPPQRIPQLVADSLLAASAGTQAGVFLRRDGTLVARAMAAGTDPAATLLAAAEAATAARECQVRRGADGVSLAAPLLLAGSVEGAIAFLAPPDVASSDELRDRGALFATVAAGLIGTERALARRRDAALAAVHRLVSRAAHELNNPLGGLKLYARLLEQRFAKAGDAYGEGLAQKVEHAIDRVTMLVANLAGQGRAGDLPPERVALNTVLAETLARLRDRLAAVDITPTLELGEGVGWLIGDREGLGQLFLHLIANAVDAAPPGGRLTVTSRRRDAATVEVVIADQGTGMDAATLARAQDLFFTTRHNATGLGLATAQSVADAFGGRIEVESEPGRGTRVTVRLPAAG